MNAYAQHKAVTPAQAVDKIVALYAKYDALNSSPTPNRRKIGAAGAQITKARINHCQLIDAIMYDENPNLDRFERHDAASLEARRQVIDALKAAGRADDKY